MPSRGGVRAVVLMLAFLIVAWPVAAGESGPASGAARSRQPGRPGHWPRGVVWVSSARTAALMGFHLEQRSVIVPARTVVAPDGRRLCRVSGSKIEIGDLPEGPWTAVYAGTPGEAIDGLRFTGAGGWLTAVLSQQGQPARGLAIPVDQPRSATTHTGETIDVARDGTLAVCKNGQLVVEEPAGRERWRSAPGRVTRLSGPRFSPDGKSIAVVETWPATEGAADTVLELFDAATGRTELLAPRVNQVTAPVWSPTGTELAFVDPAGALVVIDVATRQRRELVPARYGARSGGTQLGPFAWTPDATAIVFAVNHVASKSEETGIEASEIYAVDAGDASVWGLADDALTKKLAGVTAIEVLDLPGIPGGR